MTLLGQRWDISAWLDAADIFVLPSASEGLPAAVVEAMAKGVPVVATDVGGVNEGLGDCGRLLAPPVDPARTALELAETIAGWAADRDLRQRIGEAGRARAYENFSEGRMTEQWLTLIDGVVSDIVAARG